MSAERELLAKVLDEVDRWLGGLRDRPIPAEADTAKVAATLGGPLQDGAVDPASVIDELVAGATPGLVASPSPRFFGWVIGGTLPAALGADWLAAAWDQNAGLLASSPAAAGVERAAGAWLLDLLGLPAGAAVGFVTGGTMANFTCLAAGRGEVLRRAGWDVDADGLQGAPKVTVVTGAEVHDTVDLALRYLGLGTAGVVRVAADEQGRIRIDALRDALDRRERGPLLVSLQVGNVHSGAFDLLGEAADLVHEHGGWVHVDGAFGLWAAASPRLRHLVAGLERADSWATDAHKTLNVPYDSGLAVVADPAALQRSMGVQAAYLIQSESDPMATVPEFSRRARGFAVWAALRSLGRDGVAALVDGLCDRAGEFADAMAAIDGAEVLNEVDYTQVSVSFGPDELTREVARRLLAEGTAWMTPSTWHGRAVLRVSVSNWRTTSADVERTMDAVRRVVAEVRAERAAG